MTHRPRSLCFGALALGAIAVLAACTKESDVKVQVTGTDDACTASVGEVAAGSISFEFTNKADQISELYVLRADGSVASEVENVTTGTTRTLTADLSAGTYTLTCKPGQKGDGFSSTIEVTGEGGATVPEASGTEVEVTAKDYSFTLDSDVSFAAGDTYTFELVNDGTMQHEMEVFAPDGTAIGEVGPTDAGAKGKVTLTLETAGTYRLVCGITGHEDKGMHLDIEVK